MEVLINTLKEMVPFIKDWGALIIAGISLLVAVISLFKSSKAQRLQNKVNELELKIKQNELDKIAKEKEDSVLACVEARFITVGKGKHRLKVWNSGNATAYNVTARFDGDVAGQLCHGNGGGNDRAFKHVLRTRYDLGGLAAADVHLADQKVVAVLVRSDREDLCHNNVFNVLTERFIALNLGARIGHTVTIVFDIYIADVDEVSKPFHRKIHTVPPYQNCSRKRRSFS